MRIEAPSLPAPQTHAAAYARPALSVVVPAYNEQEVLPAFHARLVPVMQGIGLPWEVVYVNDGSRDGTLALMLGLRAQDARVSVVNLSRNFGKEIALTAGLDHAAAEQAVVVIDADLQDPPEVIPDLVAAWRQGYDVAYARRRAREGETWLKKATAAGFYRVMKRIGGKVELPADTGDFRLMSRRALDALLALREQHRFMKGLFAWVGFPSVPVLYDRAPRAAGETKWNYWKLWNLSLEGITAFTVGPLKIATYLGLFTAFGAVIYGVQLIIRTILFGNPVAGYPSLMAVVLFLGGVQLMTLGIIGEYLGRIFNETKRRPLYIVERHVPSEMAPKAGPG
ncbi:glycosyltransferase family 2 protein [Falsiroseomonas tokyonensis]|uniref:Glycosyltransferase family 2 protein n=1 Tax=Falsiroseomonas tokyonensis TaxID=430521 RepID=A0ABV7BT76_9PROT|nr:glycosyltransferase family 2 protein [Falsiroseomonas tokyonensis]MBU8538713.1 glycosyltransferase family 2 protein [Falsiroseomonas tokyonensis]